MTDNIIRTWRPPTSLTEPRQSRSSSSSRNVARLPSPSTSSSSSAAALSRIANEILELIWAYDTENVRINKCWPHDVTPKYVSYDTKKHAYFYKNKYGRPTYLKATQVAQALEGVLPGYIGGDVEIRRDTEEFQDFLQNVRQVDRALFDADADTVSGASDADAATEDADEPTDNETAADAETQE